jgi:hypothetical protein
MKFFRSSKYVKNALPIMVMIERVILDIAHEGKEILSLPSRHHLVG